MVIAIGENLKKKPIGMTIWSHDLSMTTVILLTFFDPTAIIKSRHLVVFIHRLYCISMTYLYGEHGHYDFMILRSEILSPQKP